MSLAVWTRDFFGASSNDAFSSRSVFGLILFYFYGLVVGAIAALLGAFLLRRVMAALKCLTASHWAASGAILAPVLIAILGILGKRISTEGQGGLRVLRLVTYGPMTVFEAGWWIPIPAGAATAYLLCRIQRAFAPQKSSQN